MMPNANDLYYFVEAAQTLNLSRASERLGITQPSLSLSIQRLESSLGTQLLTRNQKGVALTQAGRQFYQHSRELIEAWEKIRGQTLASLEEVQGNFTLGCHPSVAIYSLPLFLPALLEKYPHLELRMVHDLSRKISESVVQRQVDLGIVVNPIRHPDLVIRRLCLDQVTLWTGVKNREINELKKGKGTLICDPDLLQTQSLLKKMKKSGYGFSRMIPTSNLEVVAQLTAAGVGVGIIPSLVVEALFKGRLIPVLHAPKFEDEICLIYRIESKVVRSIQVLAESIRQGFE